MRSSIILASVDADTLSSTRAATRPSESMIHVVGIASDDGRPVLFVQDQTYLDFTTHPAVQGLGRIAAPNRRGASLGRDDLDRPAARVRVGDLLVHAIGDHRAPAVFGLDLVELQVRIAAGGLSARRR